MTTRALQIGFLISGVRHPTTGVAVSAGTVYFYQAGTTTAKAVYTEKEKTNPHYSYTLDSIGAATLYGDGEYKIVVKDADDATVKTIDHVRLKYEVYGVQSVSTTPYTQTTDHDMFLVDTTAGAITINALAAASWDRPIKIMRIAGANNITFDPSGSETIDSAATLVISSDAIVEIISDGSNLKSVGFRSNMADADNDTKIQVEETADEDIIRFDTGGTERVTITNTKVTSTVPIQFNAHQDTDGDTKIQVEETADEDKVRIDLGGAEKALLSGTNAEGYIKFNSHQDADGDTSLQVENTADDDKIKGTCGGAEKLLLSPTNTEAYIIVNAMMDADADTKIQVEEGADDDTVRVDTGGTERVKIDSNGLDVVSGNLRVGGVSITATPAEVNAAADGIGVSIPRQKIVEIGDWNMDADANKSVAHGLTYAKIVGTRAMIRNDADSARYIVHGNTSVTEELMITQVEATYVSLLRLGGGFFDHVNFDSTSFNRGWVILDYID